MSEYVATRWYRAPELLVMDPHYSFPVDVWTVGKCSPFIPPVFYDSNEARIFTPLQGVNAMSGST